MNAARDLLAALDGKLKAVNAATFPHPADIKASVNTARDLLAVLVQEVEEINARIGLNQEDEDGTNG